MRSLQVLSAPGVGGDLLLREPVREGGPLLLWLPAMGVPARSYQPMAGALAERGIGAALLEWRGIGSSSVRASRYDNWGYRELLLEDIPAAIRACRKLHPGVRILIGGHSLGAQLACLYASLQPDDVEGIALVASGAPYWRCFGTAGLPLYLGLSLAALTARLKGYFPGRKIGFGGNEARGVIADWARSARTGRYAARGMERNLDAALMGQIKPLLALRLEGDRMVPGSSLRYLLHKMPDAPSETQVLDAASLGTTPDHFSWMKSPGAVAGRIADWSRRLD